MPAPLRFAPAGDTSGEKGKNGVVQIATKKWKFPSNAKPLIIVDGEEFYGSVEDIPKEIIYHVQELRYPNLRQPGIHLHLKVSVYPA